MDLRKTLTLSSQVLTENSIDHALIGGFSLAYYGTARATQDIDFLADGLKKTNIKSCLMNAGFQLDFESAEVLQFSGPGFLDIILANRPLSQLMLKEAVLMSGFPVKVLRAEDIIGLKIQAYSNDSSRKLQDMADIQSLIRTQKSLDHKRVKSYADLFNCWPEIEALLK